MSDPSPQRPPVVAVIDDDEDMRTALDGLLKSLGYASRVFPTADAFLAAGLCDAVNCVISDVQMPGTSGLQLAREMQRAGTPVILITAFPTPLLERQAQAARVRKLLIKPFDSHELIEMLETILG